MQHDKPLAMYATTDHHRVFPVRCAQLADLHEDGRFEGLVAEIQTIADGSAVTKIGGDQVTRAVFFFQHPTQELCDREVVFVCAGDEWRAEG